MRHIGNSSCKSHRHLAGIALIEVLVSVTILALGLVGLAALQARSLMMNQSAHYRSIAADLAADLADRIHANRSPFLASAESTEKPQLPPDFSKCAQVSTNKDTTSCLGQPSGHETYLVANEVSGWNSAVRSQLPGATWTLESSDAAAAGFYRYKLQIKWLDDRTTASGTDGVYNLVIE